MTKHCIIPDNNKVQCQYCQRVLAKQYNLNRHLKTCKLYLNHAVQQQLSLNKQQEIDKLALELEASKMQNQQLFDKIQTVPTSTTIINNYHTNIQNYQQNNMLHVARDSIERLVPITSELLANMVRSSFAEATERSQVLDSIENLGQSWMHGALKNSVIITDTARKIAHWKDGDQNNKTIKDPKCDALSQKLQNAIDPAQLDAYYSFLQNVSTTDPLNRGVEAVNGQMMVLALKHKQAKELGTNLIKYAPNGAVKMIQDDVYHKQFVLLRSIIEASCKEKILHIMISDASQISAFWLVQNLLPKISEFVTAQKHPEDNNSLIFVVKHLKPNPHVQTWSGQQFLDLIKESICDIGLFTEQFLYVAEAARVSKDFNRLMESSEQIKSNFINFCKWVHHDRTKATNVEFIEQYETQLLSMIYAN